MRSSPPRCLHAFYRLFTEIDQNNPTFRFNFIFSHDYIRKACKKMSICDGNRCVLHTYLSAHCTLVPTACSKSLTEGPQTGRIIHWFPLPACSKSLTEGPQTDYCILSVFLYFWKWPMFITSQIIIWTEMKDLLDGFILAHIFTTYIWKKQPLTCYRYHTPGRYKVIQKGLKKSMVSHVNPHRPKIPYFNTLTHSICNR